MAVTRLGGTWEEACCRKNNEGSAKPAVQGGGGGADEQELQLGGGFRAPTGLGSLPGF